MRDTNKILKKNIIAAMQNVTLDGQSVKCFFQFVPPTEEDSTYVLINRITNENKSTFNSSDVDATFILTIHTKQTKAPNSVTVDDIADQVIQTLDTYNFDFTEINAQFLGCLLVNNDTGQTEIDPLNVYQERQLNFRVSLYLKS
jgi:hypothetical protein